MGQTQAFIGIQPTVHVDLDGSHFGGSPGVVGTRILLLPLIDEGIERRQLASLVDRQACRLQRLIELPHA